MKFIALMLLGLQWYDLVVAENESMFQRCDENADSFLTEKEFITCFGRQVGLDKNSVLYNDYKKTFDGFDVNMDGLVSLKEYGEAQNRMGSRNSHKTQTVIVKSRDGTEKEVHIDDLNLNHDNQMNGMRRTADNKLLKEEEKKANLQELSKSDPNAARIVAAGRWCFDALVNASIVAGRLKKVHSASSIPQQMSTPLYKRERPLAHIMNITLDVSTTPKSSNVKQTIISHEVIVEYNQYKYAPPLYLAMLNITRISSNGQRSIITPPEPNLRSWSMTLAAANRLLSNVMHKRAVRWRKYFSNMLAWS